MKKYSFLLLAAGLFLAACNDQADSGDANKTDESSSGTESKTTPPATPPREYSAPPSNAKVDDVVKDTPRTSVSVGKDGASVKTKKGTDVSYDKDGIKVGTKDVKIDIKRDTL